MSDMKRYVFGIILLSGLAILACNRQEEEKPVAGGLTAHIVNLETRTSYDSYVGKFAWSAGDRIALHLTNGTYYQAEVTPVTGSFACPTSSSLQREYFAVYPAAVLDESNYGNPQLGIILPAEYDISEDLASDIAPVPMVAVNREAESDLYFRHVGGLLRITVNAVPAGTQNIEVSMDGKITGSFTVRDAASDHPSVSGFTLVSGMGDPVRFKVSESGFVAATDGVILNLPVPTGHYSRVNLRALGASDAVLLNQTQNVSFDIVPARGKKMFFGVTDYQFGVTSPAALSHLAGTSTDGVVTSSMVDRGVTREVSWYVGGYYADADCTTPYDGTDAANAPAWLTSFNGNGTGDGSATGEAVTIEFADAPHAVTSETYSAEAQAKDAVIAASNFGAGSSPSVYYNLSSPAARTSDYITESANCYIVNGTGYFRIPLVLGNGVINDKPNPTVSAWQGLAGTNTVEFKDYKGAKPVSPYLHESSANVGVPTSAFVVWEDVDGLIEVADEKKFILAGSPVTRRSNCYWLNFHVAKAQQGNAVIAVTDADGTIMWSWHIWVTDFVPKNYGGNGEITMTNHYNPAYSYGFMPVNLGWVVSGLQKVVDYNADAVYVKIVQEGSDASQAMKIERTAGTETRQLKNYYPIYQWGRKDALLPIPGLGDGSDTDWYGAHPRLETDDSSYGVVDAIRNPHVIRINPADGAPWNTEDDGPNYWSAERDYQELNHISLYDIVIKTIYDPSPAGYCISPYDAFSGLTESGDNNTDSSKWHDAGRTDDGILVYSDDPSVTMLLPYLHGRSGKTGLGLDRLNDCYIWDAGATYDSETHIARGNCLMLRADTWSVFSVINTAACVPVRPILTPQTPGISTGGATGHYYDMADGSWL